MKRVIFLDTNVFESAKFSYNSHRMEKFLDTCENKKIDLYITDVIKYEVIKRIKTNIQDAIENIDKHNLEILIQSLQVESKEKLKLINLEIETMHTKEQLFNKWAQESEIINVEVYER